eukprot:g32891.t1
MTLDKIPREMTLKYPRPSHCQSQKIKLASITHKSFEKNNALREQTRMGNDHSTSQLRHDAIKSVTSLSSRLARAYVAESTHVEVSAVESRSIRDQYLRIVRTVDYKAGIMDMARIIHRNLSQDSGFSPLPSNATITVKYRGETQHLTESVFTIGRLSANDVRVHNKEGHRSLSRVHCVCIVLLDPTGSPRLFGIDFWSLWGTSLLNWDSGQVIDSAHASTTRRNILVADLSDKGARISIAPGCEESSDVFISLASDVIITIILSSVCCEESSDVFISLASDDLGLVKRAVATTETTTSTTSDDAQSRTTTSDDAQSRTTSQSAAPVIWRMAEDKKTCRKNRSQALDDKLRNHVEDAWAASRWRGVLVSTERPRLQRVSPASPVDILFATHEMGPLAQENQRPEQCNITSPDSELQREPLQTGARSTGSRRARLGRWAAAKCKAYLTVLRPARGSRRVAPRHQQADKTGCAGDDSIVLFSEPREIVHMSHVLFPTFLANIFCSAIAQYHTKAAHTHLYLSFSSKQPKRVYTNPTRLYVYLESDIVGRNRILCFWLHIFFSVRSSHLISLKMMINFHNESVHDHLTPDRRDTASF